jgi:hypothetical protein
MRAPDRRAKVERPAKDLSVRRQCELLNVARSGVYRTKREPGADDLAGRDAAGSPRSKPRSICPIDRSPPKSPPTAFESTGESRTNRTTRVTSPSARTPRESGQILELSPD